MVEMTIYNTIALHACRKSFSLQYFPSEQRNVLNGKTGLKRQRLDVKWSCVMLARPGPAWPVYSLVCFMLPPPASLVTFPPIIGNEYVSAM